MYCKECARYYRCTRRTLPCRNFKVNTSIIKCDVEFFDKEGNRLMQCWYVTTGINKTICDELSHICKRTITNTVRKNGERRADIKINGEQLSVDRQNIATILETVNSCILRQEPRTNTLHIECVCENY